MDAQFHGEVPDEGTPVVCVFVAPLLMLVVGAVLILGSSPNILFSVGNTPGQPQLESFPSSLHRHAWHDVDGTPGRHLYEVRIEMRRGPGAGAGPVNANLTVSVSS